MLLFRIGDLLTNPKPLTLADVPDPEPNIKELLLNVSVCGVCHTELDEIEGRTLPPSLPIILGHQVVGRVIKTGKGAEVFKVGDRVGVGWIFSSCGTCVFCTSGRENLCEKFRATGRDAHGGYAQLMTVSQDFAYPIPSAFSDAEAAPLLCAGAIGYRSLRLCRVEDGHHLGLTGFGASAHLMIQLVKKKYPSVTIYVFARNEQERHFAKELGAAWTGDITDPSPVKLDGIIDTTPAWRPVLEALKNLKRGGRLVINAIRKEEADKTHLLDIRYPEHLWLEKEIKSVANVTRNDIKEFLESASQIPIRPKVQEFPLEAANEALLELKKMQIHGAKVLRVGPDSL